MIQSIHIQNFRLFDKINIEGLKRINLIIGKNNTGKSTLLECIASTYWEEYFMSFFYTQLLKKKEWLGMSPEKLLNSLKPLFFNNELPLQKDLQAQIRIIAGEYENNFYYYFEKENVNGSREKLVLVNGFKSTKQTAKVTKIDLTDFKDHITFPSYVYADRKYRLIDTTGGSDLLKRLAAEWEEVVFTDKEEIVIRALQIIEPDIQRLTFVDYNKSKKILVKRNGVNEAVSLNSMGDGLIHILDIILNLIRCENGACLIDEFENGLHWSVQEDLWKILMELSQRLNIQIFATSHSRDTLWALQRAANLQNKSGEICVLKLLKGRKSGKIKSNIFAVDDVAIALEQDIEIR